MSYFNVSQLSYVPNPRKITQITFGAVLNSAQQTFSSFCVNKIHQYRKEFITEVAIGLSLPHQSIERGAD